MRPGICGYGACCQGICCVHWSERLGESCPVSRLQAGNVKHGDPVLWEWRATQGSSSWLHRLQQQLCMGVLAGSTFLPRCPQVDAQESGTGGTSLPGVSEAPVQGSYGKPVCGEPILSPGTPFPPGHDRLDGPQTVRVQCLVPIYSTPVND